MSESSRPTLDIPINRLGDLDLRRHAREIELGLDRYDDEMANSTYAGRVQKD